MRTVSERPVLRIGDGEMRAERPGARRRGVAVGVEGFAGRGALAGGIVAGENFLARRTCRCA